MILLSMPVMDEISRYLEYGWEWKTVCKVINFKHCYDFDIFEIEKLYFNNLARYKELKKLQDQSQVFEALWLGNE